MAHLPIVEYYPSDLESEDNDGYKCACARVEKNQSTYTKGVKTHRWVAAYTKELHNLITNSIIQEDQGKPGVRFNPDSPIDIPDECHCENLTEDERKNCRKTHQVDICPNNRACRTPLSKVFVNMFGIKGNNWIEKKVNEFYKQQGNKRFLHSEIGGTSIPVAFLDFLLIDYSDVLRRNRQMLNELKNTNLDNDQIDKLRGYLNPKLVTPPYSEFDKGGYGE